MGHLHVSKIKFRLPVPDVVSCRKARDSRQHRQQTDNTNCLAADFLVFFLTFSVAEVFDGYALLCL